MRVAIDVTSVLYGEKAIRRNSRILAVELMARSRDIEYVLFYVDPKGLPGRIPVPPGSPHRERILRLPGRLARWSWRRLRWPAVETLLGPIDLVFATDLLFPPSRRAVSLSTIHGIAYLAVPELFSADHRDHLRRGLAYAIGESDYHLAVSERTRAEITEHLGIPADRIRVCPNAVDPAFRRLDDRGRVAEVLRERFRIEGRYAIYVGSISCVKNVVRLIEAFSRVAGQIPDLGLVLVGPFADAHREAEALVAARSLGSRVRFLGPVPPESDDLLHLYNGASLLLHPTLYEGWTAPPVEAMACGVPVVASNCSSLPESCGGAALLVDPLDPAAIAKGALDVLTGDRLREILIEKGYARAAACTWARSAERMEEIFRELVALGRRR